MNPDNLGSRRITVSSIAGSTSRGRPNIRITRRWIGDPGFAIGSKANVEVSHR
jgi:hypothetical protein